MTKEKRRREEALRKRQKQTAAKGAVIVLSVTVLGLIGYLLAAG